MKYGRLWQVTDWSSRVTTYSYDLASRLTRIDRPNGTYRINEYDAAGQLRICRRASSFIMARPGVLNGQVRIERVSVVLTGSEAEIYLDFFSKKAEDLVRFGLVNIESKTTSGIAVSDLVISFLFNEHIGTFEPGAACKLRGVVIIWNGNKGAEYPILEAPNPEKKQFLTLLLHQQLLSPYLDGWQVKWGRTSRTLTQK